MSGYIEETQGLVFLEFSLDAPETVTAEATEPTYSFTLVVQPGAEPPVRFFQTIELIYFVREQVNLGLFPSEMTYIGPDAQWRDEAEHAADERCRTVDSGCVASIQWPNGTWPSRQ
jgi:hypothetical protein